MTIYENAAHTTAVRHLQRQAVKNPAKALYAFWHIILDGACAYDRGRSSVQFGDVRISTSENDERGRPILGIGNFVLNARGEFQLYSMHGAHQRNIVAKHTFLQWAHWRSSYNWYVSTDFEGWYGGHIHSWENPVHYVSEGLIRAKSWAQKPWLRLLPDDQGGWYIGLANPGAPHPRFAHGLPPTSQAEFDKFDALRRRRYYLMEREHRVRMGEWDAKGRRIPTAEETRERQAGSVAAFVAHLDITAPARTVPLRKIKEKEDTWQPNGSR